MNSRSDELHIMTNFVFCKPFETNTLISRMKRKVMDKILVPFPQPNEITNRAWMSANRQYQPTIHPWACCHFSVLLLYDSFSFLFVCLCYYCENSSMFLLLFSPPPTLFRFTNSFHLFVQMQNHFPPSFLSMFSAFLTSVSPFSSCHFE